MSPIRCDVVVLGSGFAGSILARVLAVQGLDVVLVERGRHPRFSLGESSTPLAGFALERLAGRYGLEDLHHLSTYGRWQRHLPHLRCGLKRGFSFFRHRRGQTYRNSAANEARLLVAASPEDRLADTHWLRADVDHHLVEEAVAAGVRYLDQTDIRRIELLAGSTSLRGRRGQQALEIRAEQVVDASGPAALMARCQPARLERRPVCLETALLYGHFEGLRPLADVAGSSLNPGPFPDEQAAVHHLLDEGWMYMLPFDHGVTSCGVLLHPAGGGVEAQFAQLTVSDPESGWRHLLASYPTLAAQLADARPVVAPRLLRRVQHRLSRAAGPGWFLLPHTYAFFDPMFSTGMAWSLLAVERLAKLIPARASGRRYADLMSREADHLERLINAAYQGLADFDLFTSVAHLYFAAASFAEVGQRLSGEEDLAWEGFLGCDDPILAAAFEHAPRRLRRARESSGARNRRAREEFSDWIRQTIAPRNIAGLADPSRRNLYPVDLDLLVERHSLLGLSRAEVQAALPKLRGEQPASFESSS